MRRGEVWWARLPAPSGNRPVVLLSRDQAIQVRDLLIVAQLSRRVRGLKTEVMLEPEDGVPTSCAINCDVIRTIPKAALTNRITTLSNDKLQQLDDALRFALGL